MRGSTDSKMLRRPPSGRTREHAFRTGGNGRRSILRAGGVHGRLQTRSPARRARDHGSQVDFLSPRGLAWRLVGESVVRNHTVENIERLLQAAKRASMAVAISPHYDYPSAHRWGFGGPLETLMDRIGLPIALDAPEQHGADLLPAFTPYFLDEDATAAALDQGDGYQAALVNFRYIADALWSTDEAVRQV